MGADQPKKPEVRSGTALAQIAPQKGLVVGSLRGALATLGQGGTLTRALRGELAALRLRGSEEGRSKLDSLTQGAMDIEIAPDFSASTAELQTALTSIADSLRREVAHNYPAARVAYGIFGGGEALATGQSERVMRTAHESTEGWESTFGSYLERYAQRPTTGRQQVLISFHDARPKAERKLFQSIQAINEKGAMVFIVYLPSSGSEGADKAMLQDLATQGHGGFERGVFVDLSGVDYTNPEVTRAILEGLIEVAAEVQREHSQLNAAAPLASLCGQKRLGELAQAVVKRAKALTSGPQEE